MTILALSSRALAASPDAKLPAADDVLPQQLSVLELEDSEGRRVRPFASTNTRAALQVLVFVSIECPISNQYAPEIRRLFDAYHPRGAKFWLVHPIRDESPQAIRKHATDYSLPGEILRDPDCSLTQLAGATVTPEAVVLDRELHVLYRGRIDDRFPALGRKRVHATEFDLRDALDAALAGKPIEQARTKAVGCTIPRPN